MKLKRTISITQAYDRRSDKPNKDYGIGACRIFFSVKGSKGAITVNFFTNWFLPSTIKEYKEEGIYCNNLSKGKDSFKTKIDLIATTDPISSGSWDIHSKKKLYEDQTSYSDNCEFTGGKCYCDGSCMKAEEYLQILFEKGSKGVLDKLEEDYNEQFVSLGLREVNG